MIADVPLGAFLSGGVDSSAVVALMAQQSKRSGEYLLDRLRRAAIRRVQIRRRGRRALQHRPQHAKLVDPDSFDLVDRLAGFFDEPFADSSAMPTYRVCELARERVTVALSGDAGDELFAGYRRYRWHAYEQSIRNRFPQAHARAAVQGARPAVSQARLGAEIPARQIDFPGAGGGSVRRLFPQRVDPARRASRAACSTTTCAASCRATAPRTCWWTPCARPRPTTTCRARNTPT